MIERARLWHDGHGIERLPITVQIDGQDAPVVVVRAADLLALEDVLCEASNIVALCGDSGIHWNDPDDRAKFFEKADVVWRQMSGVWRGDDHMYEDDDDERPQ